MSSSHRTLLYVFLLQVLFSVVGHRLFYYHVNPFALLAVSVAVPILSLKFFEKNATAEHPAFSRKKRWLFVFFALLPFLLAYEEWRKMVVKFADLYFASDVLMQLKSQSDWFFSGENAYQWVQFPGHRAFPVYMPLHWAPFQITAITGLEIRWVGLLILMAAVGVVAWFLAKQTKIQAGNRPFWLLALWAVPLWAFIHWSELEVAVSLETVVAAYYFLLAGGLATRNHWLIAAGLIGCVLSRYTVVFWVPAFAWLLWRFEPRRYSYAIWGSLALAVLGLYAVPFILKHPDILKQGLEYHNYCARGGYERPDDSNYSQGLNLAMYFKKYLPGDADHRLFLTRAIQGGLMLLICLASVIFYEKKWKSRIDIYSWSLLTLQMILVCYFIFCPMTFQYYLLVPMMIGGLICWRAMSG